ncbi:MAG: hypothetical protein MUF78_10100 [Candidatus Edwardsbacteria bacterium]|jgi:hypothetical protein|nr:hypothetical protein [Candidatus Edwardsbacteria bacterium]
MKVKGTAIAALPKFIEHKFGSAGLEQWKNALSTEGQKIYRGAVMLSDWYPIKESYLEPTALMCEQFYRGDTAGARELGRFAADFTLKGVYKAFVKMHSVKAFCNRTVDILHAYYDPCQAKVVLVEDNRATLQLTLFPVPSEYAELRIAGWTERAFEIHGRKNIRVEITRSLVRGDDCTEFSGTWE